MKDKDHTVSYRPTEYYSMCETSKRRIKEMQDQGISTKYDAKEKQEDVGKNDSYTFMVF
jgi:hypothetical protein